VVELDGGEVEIAAGGETNVYKVGIAEPVPIK
jgi:hypothetical protein